MILEFITKEKVSTHVCNGSDLCLSQRADRKFFKNVDRVLRNLSSDYDCAKYCFSLEAFKQMRPVLPASVAELVFLSEGVLPSANT